jgi:hypothetical protein
LEEVQKAVSLANKIKTGASMVMRKSVMEITGQDWESNQEPGSTTDRPRCC